MAPNPLTPMQIAAAALRDIAELDGTDAWRASFAKLIAAGAINNIADAWYAADCPPEV